MNYDVTIRQQRSEIEKLRELASQLRQEKDEIVKKYETENVSLEGQIRNYKNQNREKTTQVRKRDILVKKQLKTISALKKNSRRRIDEIKELSIQRRKHQKEKMERETRLKKILADSDETTKLFLDFKSNYEKFLKRFFDIGPPTATFSSIERKRIENETRNKIISEIGSEHSVGQTSTEFLVELPEENDEEITSISHRSSENDKIGENGASSLSSNEISTSTSKNRIIESTKEEKSNEIRTNDENIDSILSENTSSFVTNLTNQIEENETSNTEETNLTIKTVKEFTPNESMKMKPSEGSENIKKQQTITTEQESELIESSTHESIKSSTENEKNVENDIFDERELENETSEPNSVKKERIITYEEMKDKETEKEETSHPKGKRSDVVIVSHENEDTPTEPKTLENEPTPTGNEIVHQSQSSKETEEMEGETEELTKSSEEEVKMDIIIDEMFKEAGFGSEEDSENIRKTEISEQEEEEIKELLEESKDDEGDEESKIMLEMIRSEFVGEND